MTRVGFGGLFAVAILGLVALAIGMLPQGAQADEVTVDTHAYVAEGESAPIINAKWELPDMQPVSPTTVEYAAASGPTDYNGNGIPDADDDPLTPGMQMYPNLEDSPAQRLIEYWVAVEDPDGIGDILSVWVDVYEPVVLGGGPPNLTFKYQIDLALVGCEYIGLYDDSVTPAILVLYAPLLAAIDTGQITQAEAEALVIHCYKNEKAIYVGTGDLSKHQPWGTYEVRAGATDWASGEAWLVNHFCVLPIIGLVKDFTVVDWGKIKALTTDWVSGDTLLTTADKPTIKNTGNALMHLGLHFHTMVGVDDPTKIIDSFDAKWMGETLDFPASHLIWFQGLLGSNDVKQLDLSIHPPAKLTAQEYAGTVEVHAYADGDD